ncbi:MULTISPECIES: helix-turn-helix transcriptional regulator [unclassified Caulobacter]|uniref:helix-turn-helix transcriptional regulator n=1 Tax=unclassified Caulobacter TaxID=2648921 RepID=UPI000D3A2C1B|nr:MULTISPECIES: helix-turn-helix domain-containing protein [unclassified Caulobacter]PTS87869.1 hypothetical protein DBR21_11250 [Caulobacter sp. HMWF009]PTT11184.1 hypothetical protein DBR10_03990 [Caulobacter sp. HMWF025]
MLLPLSEPVPLAPGLVARVQQVRQEADEPLPRRFLHFHGPAELVLIEDGAGQFLCEDALLPFSAGTLLYAPAMAIHDFDFSEGPRAWTLVQFDPLALDPGVVAPPAGPRSSALDDPMRLRIRVLLDWLNQSIQSQLPRQAVAVQLQALVLAISQTFGPAPEDLSSPLSSLSRFRPILDQLSRFPFRTLTLEEAASRCAMSPAYFSRCFSRTFGTGFIAYQGRLRLQQAARIIATSDEPISQVGYRLGFRSPAYFAYCFKSLFGVTPSEHRRII